MGADLEFERRLAEPVWGDPLTLMMAGLTAVETGVPAALAMNRVDLALRLAGVSAIEWLGLRRMLRGG